MNRLIFLITYLPIRLYSKWARPREALIFLFRIQKKITTIISDRASDYEGGVHPKHRLMQYHLFFTRRLQPGERVLDIGSGRGFLSHEIVKTGAKVTGLELAEKNVTQANNLYQNQNLKFIVGDVWQALPKEKFDTIVMSNILEHIDDRVGLIKKVQSDIHPKRWLFRVPCFDRDWQVPLARELGLDSRLDETHFTEYTDESFRKEMTEAGLAITHLEKQWGEIWAEAIPIHQ